MMLNLRASHQGFWNLKITLVNYKGTTDRNEGDIERTAKEPTDHTVIRMENTKGRKRRLVDDLLVHRSITSLHQVWK